MEWAFQNNDLLSINLTVGMVHVEFFLESALIFGSRISDRTCDIKYDKSKTSIKTLVSPEIVLLATLGKVLDHQAIRDTQLFSLARKITCSPVLLHEGKFAKDASL